MITKEWIGKVSGSNVTDENFIEIELVAGDLPQFLLDDDFLLGTLNPLPSLEPYQTLGSIQWTVVAGKPQGNYTVNEISLSDYKTARQIEIDVKTRTLIGGGFVYAARTFSLSLPAQKNWMGLKVQETSLVWPVKITTINDAEYSLAQANLTAFTDAAMNIVQGHLDTGRALKISIDASTSHSAVEGVIDTR